MALHVEHIDRVIARAPEQQAIVLLGIPQRAFRLLALRHVVADAEHADRGAAFVADHLADAVQITDAAVRADDALLVAEVLARLERGADGWPDLRTIIGVDETDEFLQRAFELAGPKTVDVEQLLRPGHRVLHHVPAPAAEIGETLRFRQMDIGVGECRGALLDTLIEIDLGAPQLVLDPSAHRHVGAERQARHRDADHEGEQQQERMR